MTTRANEERRLESELKRDVFTRAEIAERRVKDLRAKLSLAEELVWRSQNRVAELMDERDQLEAELAVARLERIAM